jgi:hypothetical protein
MSVSRGGVLSAKDQSMVTRPTSILHVFMTESLCDQYNAGRFYHDRPPATIRDMAVYTRHVVSPKDLSLATHANIRVCIFMTESLCDGYTPSRSLPWAHGTAGLARWAHTITARSGIDRMGCWIADIGPNDHCDVRD